MTNLQDTVYIQISHCRLIDLPHPESSMTKIGFYAMGDLDEVHKRIGECMIDLNRKGFAILNVDFMHVQ